jgi:molybdate transport system regulatory protein
METSQFKFNGRLWIEVGNEPVLGPGRVELLERIKETGSIRQAAIQMKMSYRQAWQLIEHMNTYFSEPVVISHRGGKGGGSAEVTEKGIKAIAEFKEFYQKFRKFLADHSHEINL